MVSHMNLWLNRLNHHRCEGRCPRAEAHAIITRMGTRRGSGGHLGRYSVVIVRKHDVKLLQMIRLAPKPHSRDGMYLESAVHPEVLRQQLRVHVQRKPKEASGMFDTRQILGWKGTGSAEGCGRRAPASKTIEAPSRPAFCRIPV